MNFLEEIQEQARQAMRHEIEQRKAAGQDLFTQEQLGILHQQIRDQRARAA